MNIVDKLYTNNQAFDDTSLGLLESFRFRTLEDFDIYEKLYTVNYGADTIKKFNPNFYGIKKEFREKIGKPWYDKKRLRYTFNDGRVYVKYKIIGVDLESENYYWVLKCMTYPDEDLRYINMNDPDFI